MAVSSSPFRPELEFAAGEVVLDKFRIARKLGEGGFGRVYEAEELPGGRRVALKLGRGAEDERRMAREARLASLLTTPHAVRVFGVDRVPGGSPVIVMELLEGLSLREYLAMRGRVEPRLAVDWARQLALALREAHSLGLLHRDLKPSNVFIANKASGGAVLKLLDFGLARAPAAVGEPSVTDSKLVLGSPAYMSPEQIRSEGVGIQTDIWSFGVVLHEMLAGSRPFSAESNSALLAAIVADPPQPLAAVCPNLAPGLHRVVERCLRKRPAERFASIEEVITALEAVRAADSCLSAPVTTTVTQTRSARGDARGPARAKLARAGILLAFAAAALAAWRYRTGPERTSERSTPRALPSAASVSALTLETRPAPEAPEPAILAADPAAGVPTERLVPTRARAAPGDAERPRRAVKMSTKRVRPSSESPNSEPAVRGRDVSRVAPDAESRAPQLFLAEPDF